MGMMTYHPGHTFFCAGVFFAAAFEAVFEVAFEVVFPAAFAVGFVPVLREDLVGFFF